VRSDQLGAMLHFNLLGPLEVTVDGLPVPVGGLHQRAVLAYLLLNANKTVAASQLVRSVWGEEAPPTARKMLQSAVAGLRELLALAGDSPDRPTLVTRPPGYGLLLDPEQVDLNQFLCLVSIGRAELNARNWIAAVTALREAWALWRGPVVADLVEEGIAWRELSFVRSAKWSAFEDRMDAELAVGCHGEVLAELESAVGEEPLRERLCSQLMIALYRSGRHADSLEVYRQYRDRLVDRLGLEPAPQLRGLQQAILNHDLMLTTPPLFAQANGQAEPGATGPPPTGN
jgi:DNA-binding SARP family transcriptional activator